jgi:DNA-directed RNA polymerase subunit RPC12/RpoP
VVKKMLETMKRCINCGNSKCIERNAKHAQCVARAWEPIPAGQGLRCPYCGGKAKLTGGGVIYNKSWEHRKFWACEFYPGCDAYVGCHPGSDKPLGTLANAALRKARGACHILFDQTWLCKPQGQREAARNAAYAHLARLLSIPLAKCHFAMFDQHTCALAQKMLTQILTPQGVKP